MTYYCSYCGCELVHHDSFGYFAAHQSGQKRGDIWKCPACDENGAPCLYHTHLGAEYDLHEGHPC
jgi:hypothetical protein